MPNRVSSLFADLGPHTLLPTRANSLASEETRTNLYGTNNPLHASLPPSQQNPVNNGTQDASFFSRQPWQPPQDLNLQWTWIEGNGPFITNGQGIQPHFETSDSKSDTTAIMFNLDSLNESRPKTMQCHGWEKCCNRPRLLNPQIEHNGPTQSDQIDCPIDST